jgi:hypothetical protein
VLIYARVCIYIIYVYMPVIFYNFQMGIIHNRLRPTQPPVQWVPGVLSPGVKRGWGVMLTTHPHLAPAWRVAGLLDFFSFILFILARRELFT